MRLLSGAGLDFLSNSNASINVETITSENTGLLLSALRSCLELAAFFFVEDNLTALFAVLTELRLLLSFSEFIALWLTSVLKTSLWLLLLTEYVLQM